MKVTRINHISVNVDGSTGDEIRAFYAGLLGMPLINHERPQEFKDVIPGDWYALGSKRLHVFEYEEGGQWRTPGSPQPGGPHFALYVDDLAAAEAELTQRAIPFWSHGEGEARQLWILDPGGNTVELGQDPNVGAA
ncbi:hypothetical protein GCM10009087_36360 [Sphingomonas oligophenolica]|uniref:VOC family protein n=1 Tax=Sphingomonas oligophenolica TaxID=301154 RepID=A0ABU9Y983_9SPHN